MFKVFTRLSTLVRNLRTLVSDSLRFFVGVCRRRTALSAENLFLWKQLAVFRERDKKAMPTTPAERFVFSKLSHWFDWRSALNDRQASHFDRLASQCIPPLLALEVATGGKATTKCRS
jgi:hypothetical protein